MMVLRDIDESELFSLDEIQKDSFKSPLKFHLLYDCFAADNYVIKGLFDDERSLMLGYYIVIISEEYADIVQIATRKEFRQLGIASAMLEQLLLAYKNLDNIFLEVRKSNVGAIALYQKFGFQQYNIRKRYYTDGEDALLFKKEKVK